MLNIVNYKNPRVIAEVGANHKGDLELAKEFIKVAKEFADVDIVKFQKRDIKTWADKYPELYNGPHPNQMHAFGNTYKEHRENLEFSIEQHAELKKYAESIGVEWSTSVWDLVSAQEVTKLNPKVIKIPSGCNTNLEMLEYLAQEYSGEIHISTGMTTKEEINAFVKVFVDANRNKDLVIYNCTSGYPVPAENVCLLDILKFREEYQEKVKEIGFSGHHNGISIDVAAYTLGASTIERHFTLNRTWKGTDHAASLEPDGLRRLVRNLREAKKALQYKETEILEIEEAQRKKLKW